MTATWPQLPVPTIRAVVARTTVAPLNSRIRNFTLALEGAFTHADAV